MHPFQRFEKHVKALNLVAVFVQCLVHRTEAFGAFEAFIVTWKENNGRLPIYHDELCLVLFFQTVDFFLLKLHNRDRHLKVQGAECIGG